MRSVQSSDTLSTMTGEFRSDAVRLESHRGDWRIVRAGPASPIGLRVPSRCRAVTVEHVRPRGAQADRVIEVTVKLELRQADDVSVGPYDLRSITIAAHDETGISPEFVRSLPLASYITKACQDIDRVVHIDPDTGVVTDHRTPELTLSGDELVIACWLRSKLANGDTNKAVAALLHTTTTAAAQRISRLRAAGKLPPAETRERADERHQAAVGAVHGHQGQGRLVRPASGTMTADRYTGTSPAATRPTTSSSAFEPNGSAGSRWSGRRESRSRSTPRRGAGRRRGRSPRRRRYSIKRAYPIIGGKQLGSIDGLALQTLQRRLFEHPYKRSTVEQTMHFVKAALRQAHADRLIRAIRRCG